MKLSACALTDPGLRRSNNEDSVYADCAAGLYIVADGMGGHAAGEVASGMAVEILCAHHARNFDGRETGAGLQEAFRDATRSIRRNAADNPARKGMGTTLSALCFKDDILHLAHVGDSRIYRLRDKKLEQLSIDHSLVAEQVRQGLISAEEARQSQMRNILLQAIGLEDEVDVFQLQQEIRRDDSFLLCSDGLSDMLEDARIEQLLARPLLAQQLAQDLIDAANSAGGRDNIGVVVIQTEG